MKLSKSFFILKPLILGISCLFTYQVLATPPEYASFKREQTRSYSPKESELVRIWMINIGQGDSILIQIPGEMAGIQDDYFDVLVDAGQYSKANDFLKVLYSEKHSEDYVVDIEYAVITHHDSDHVSGFSYIFENSLIYIENIFHNGLASYLPNKFSNNTLTNKTAVYSTKHGEIDRVMGMLEPGTNKIRDIDVIKDLDKLESTAKLQGVYKNLHDGMQAAFPEKPISFDRAYDKSKFITINNDDISFNPIWPLTKLKKYGAGWSETINGNSVTFNFSYGDFQMLFTGDHNEKSEKEMLDYFIANNRTSELISDILKVPHHGSSHGYEDFFKHKDVKPVLSVASMGGKGFGKSWKHPSDKVIKWLGGAHKFYSTYVKEKKFKYDNSFTSDVRKSLIEKTHILIETDGKWFRIVEIPVDDFDGLESIPSVKSTARSNGTRWIKAVID